MTVEELRERLEELENTRRLAQAELETLAEHEGCIKERVSEISFSNSRPNMLKTASPIHNPLL